MNKNIRDKRLEGFYRYESEISNARIKYFNKIINENPEMSIEKTGMITKLKGLYALREEYFRSKFNNPEKNKSINLKLIDDEIRQLEDELKKQQSTSLFTYKNDFVKLLNLLSQLLTKNSSKKLKNGINQILKELYNSKQYIIYIQYIKKYIIY